MFREVAPHLHIYCDYDQEVLRVAVDEPVALGFMGIWREVEAFDTREAWMNSPYASRISENEEIVVMIEWFWHDLKGEERGEEEIPVSVV